MASFQKRNPAFSYARMAATLATSGPITHYPRAERAEDHLPHEGADGGRPQPPADQLRLADEQVHAGGIVVDADVARSLASR